MYADVRDEIKEAIWQTIQGGNSAWMTYYCKDTPPGTNNRSFSTGHVDSHEVDRRGYAGEPWTFKAQKVREAKKCFGPWSRRHDGTMHFVCFDLEPTSIQAVNGRPSKGKHTKVEAPDQDHIERVAQWTREGFEAGVELAQAEPSILAVLPVHTSSTNYHLWLILDHPVTREEHDRLLGRFYDLHPYVHGVLDKDSSNSKKGTKGDHFRAPWTWKKGRESQAIDIWIRDEQRLIEVGRSLEGVTNFRAYGYVV